jgi:NADH:ubiquinone oxidoreductase subunit 3 (subunit A)
MMQTALLVMLAYIAVLVIGFIYAWRKGAFEWD